MKPDIKRVKSLYGVQSFDAATAYAKKNFKDAGGIILARNLEHVSAEIFTQEFAWSDFLAARNRGQQRGWLCNQYSQTQTAH